MQLPMRRSWRAKQRKDFAGDCRLAALACNRSRARDGDDADPDAIALLSARVTGRIVKVLAREGDHIRAGHVIAIVSSPELARLRGDYAGGSAKASAARQNAERLRALVTQRIGAEQDAVSAAFAAAEDRLRPVLMTGLSRSVDARWVSGRRYRGPRRRARPATHRPRCRRAPNRAGWEQTAARCNHR